MVDKPTEVEIQVEYIPDSGQCGGIGDIGGAYPGLTEKFRRRTSQCTDDAEYQVFAKTEPPEHAMIVGVCEEHIGEAKEYIEKRKE